MPVLPPGRLLTNIVPFENRNSGVDLRFVGASGGVRVFVDQAAQDGFSEDPSAVEVGHGDAVSVGFVGGDALGDALVRPSCVVVHLVFGQDGTQMGLPRISTRSRRLRRRVPTRRSQIAFIRGARPVVPKTSSRSCDQAIFVDQASDASVSSSAVLLKIDRFG